MCRIVEQHGLVAGVEQGSEGAGVGALIVRIIRVRFLSLFSNYEVCPIFSSISVTPIDGCSMFH